MRTDHRYQPANGNWHTDRDGTVHEGPAAQCIRCKHEDIKRAQSGRHIPQEGKL